jgi:hypothetical protein
MGNIRNDFALFLNYVNAATYEIARIQIRVYGGTYVHISEELMHVLSKNTKNSLVLKFRNIWIPSCQSEINKNSDILKRCFIPDVILRELDSGYELYINVTARMSEGN